MPVTKSARKKLRKDRKRESQNKKIRASLEKAIKEVKKSATEKRVQEVFSLIDKASKKNIIHKNRAARIKSSLSKLINRTPAKTAGKSAKSPQKKSKSPKK